MFQSSLDKGPFYAIKGFFELNEKKKARNLFCTSILDDEIYETEIFPIVLLFRKPVWSLLMIFGRTFLMRFAIDLAAIL